MNLQEAVEEETYPVDLEETVDPEAEDLLKEYKGELETFQLYLHLKEMTVVTIVLLEQVVLGAEELAQVVHQIVVIMVVTADQALQIL